ncbi:MAG: hypothetical protein EOP08_11990, partial [Proteobacteria bacterium]
DEGRRFPRPVDPKRQGPVAWQPPVYRSVLAVLQNPFYAGAYAYGKSEVQTTIAERRLRKVYGRLRPRDTWRVLLPDHHEAYISWEEFERNQVLLARNAFGKRSGGAKSARGGRALLAGMLRCRRCGRGVAPVRPDTPRRLIGVVCTREARAFSSHDAWCLSL